MSKRITLTVSIFFIALTAFSQEAKKTIPLHAYLQSNFDTTIIIHTYSSWYIYPNYQIISIKNGSIHAFTYKDPLAGFIPWGYGGLPKELGDKFIKRMTSFQTSLPDTNIYFIPYKIISNKKVELKRLIDSLQVWAIDDNDIKNCKDLDSDATEYKIWLITKNTIKQLSFYDPEQCPGSMNLQKAVQLIKAFNSAFH